MGAINPQSCSCSNRASMDGADDGKEEEAEMQDPQSCSSSNWASMDGTSDGREEEAETLDPQSYSSSNRASITLAATEQVWMVSVMRNPNPHTRDTRRWMKSKLCRTKNLMRPTPASDFGWRKRDFFLVQSKGKNIFGLCFPCLNCVILNLGDALGFWRGLDSSTLYPYPWPFHSLYLKHCLGRALGDIRKVKSLKLLQNSRICKWRRATPLPHMSYIGGKPRGN